MFTKLVYRSVFLTLIFFNISAQASDIAKEKRWADQTIDAIMTGDAVWLKTDGHKFLGIYTEPTTDKILGGAIILHGIGVHPNWSDVIQPLRTRLPDAGWHTLSLQMPILKNEAKEIEYKKLFPEITPRINAGIKYLKGKGIKNIVIVGHSMGATMAGYFVAHNSKAGIRALVAIGATGRSFNDPKLDYIASLKMISIPVMDLSGSDDLPGVVKVKKLKTKTAREAGNKHYQAIEIQGANHFLAGKEDEMVNEVSKWLKKYN